MNYLMKAPRGNRLLAFLLAAGMTAAADAQGPGPAAYPTTALPGSVQAYAVAANAKGVASKLKQMYARVPGVSVADTATGQIIVQGPPSVQNEIVQWLQVEGLTPPVPSAAVRQVAHSEPQRSVSQTWQLKNLTPRDFETKLTKTWGQSLQSSQDSVGDVATFRFPPTAAGTSSIVVDRRANTATVTSPASSLTTWHRLLSILDSRPRSASEQTSIVPVLKADPSTIRRAAAILSQYFAGGADPHRKLHIGQFVSMLFQAEGNAQPAGGGGAQPATGQPAPAPAPAAPPAGESSAAQPITPGSPNIASMEAIARINNVQIEILEDVIVVRGRKEDVDRVLQIIEQIEQQSLQFKPEIEIYYLKHVDSQAMADMINTLSATAFARLGTVTVQALQRPNAILLIGRKENIPSIIELIAKLDVPAPAEGERKIFRLENMSAIDAERTIRTFFVSRPPTDTTLRQGLGTRALVIADYRSNSLIVQAAPRDMIEITRLIADLDVATSAATQEVRVFKLRNSIAETLAPILTEAITQEQTATNAGTVTGGGAAQTPARATPPQRSLQFIQVGPGGQRTVQSGIMANVLVNADARTNSLIVTAPSSSMELIAALIQQLDMLPASEAQIKVFNIRNGDATSLAEMLTNLFGQPQQANQQAAAGAVAPTPSGDSAIVPLRFSVDQRTNSIIATGNAGDLNVIYAILSRLDEGDIRQRKTTVYRLRNAPAQDVSNALTQLLQQQLTLIQIAPELVTPVEQIERQVIVVPEIVTNSLIVSATEKYFNEITRIIETLDRRPPMVVIQVVLAEVNLDDFEQFGVEWGLQDALMFDRSIPPVAGAALQPGYNFNSSTPILPNQNSAPSLATAPRVATQALSNLVVGRTDSTLGFGGLVLTASSESVSVLLRALESSSRGQIISRPQVQTLDNLPAFVQVGSLVPRIQGVTATNTAVIPVIADINVGLILQVTPRTSPDGTIVMQVYAEKSVVGPQATAIPIGTDTNGNPILSPQIPRTLAQTTVSARTGQTVILGGLITKDLEETSRRIPYLADIPVIGRLFRFDTARNTRKELLIILTPYLVTSDEQIEWINARESERMSWCVADIVNIHGPVNLGGNPAYNAGATPLIFPDLQPGGAPGSVPAGPIGPGTPGGPNMPGGPGMIGPGMMGPGMYGMPGGGYPPGPPPYTEIPQTGNSREPVPPGPLPPGPGGFPSGPAPYSAPPPPAPTPATPPPPTPGLGSSRRIPEGGVVIPQPQSLMQPKADQSTQSNFGPPTIQPAAPPAGTVVPVAGMQAIGPPQYPPQGPPQQNMPPGRPPMVPLPAPGYVTPASYQQPTR